MFGIEINCFWHQTCYFLYSPRIKHKVHNSHQASLTLCLRNPKLYIWSIIDIQHYSVNHEYSNLYYKYQYIYICVCLCVYDIFYVIKRFYYTNAITIFLYGILQKNEAGNWQFDDLCLLNYADDVALIDFSFNFTIFCCFN